VEVGLLLDQLVGYFRDVMAAAVGCTPDQMLYALPSQAEEVAQISRQLGIATILAIGQILDHTAARMRVSMHGRTLVEMAIVRICQLDELEDLAALVAQLRGTARQGQAESVRPADAKKNDELQHAAHREAIEPTARRSDRPHGTRSRTGEPPGPAITGASSRPDQPAGPPNVEDASIIETTEPALHAEVSAPAADSVLAQWQRALAENGPARPTTPPRPSRREQLATIAEQPFVRRAMELFDVPPEKLRYTPPDGDSN
jgi:DNA polymerase-3 subunit gamma/tau